MKDFVNMTHGKLGLIFAIALSGCGGSGDYRRYYVYKYCGNEQSLGQAEGLGANEILRAKVENIREKLINKIENIGNFSLDRHRVAPIRIQMCERANPRGFVYHQEEEGGRIMYMILVRDTVERAVFDKQGRYPRSWHTGVIAHETVHTLQTPNSRNFPMWIKEGLANYLADGIDGAVIRKMPKNRYKILDVWISIIKRSSPEVFNEIIQAIYNPNYEVSNWVEIISRLKIRGIDETNLVKLKEVLIEATSPTDFIDRMATFLRQHPLILNAHDVSSFYADVLLINE